MDKVKVIDESECEITKKFAIIKKIIPHIQCPNVVNPNANANANKPIIINEDRLAYKVDILFSTYHNLSKDIKCGKLQTNRKQFIEHLEELPLSTLTFFYEILDYDRNIYNL